MRSMAIGYTVAVDRLTGVPRWAYSHRIEIVESAHLVNVEAAEEVDRRITGFLSE